jgi:YHS domain-containing protein
MNTAKDPVCGMDVEQDQAAGQSEYQGNTYHFCSNECKEQFDQNPEAFVKQKQKAAGGAKR